MKILLFFSHLIKLMDFAMCIYTYTHIVYEYISAFTFFYINNFLYLIFLMNIKNVDKYDTNLGFQ